MTLTPRFKTRLAGRRGTVPRAVILVLFAEGQLLDIVGPLEVFDCANRLLESKGKPPPYSLHVVAPSPQVVTVSGLAVVCAGLETAPRAHTVLFGGSAHLPKDVVSRQQLAKLRCLVKPAERVVSVCTGAFILGQLGLLDERRCTTHWLRTAELRQRFPRALVEEDSLFTEDGRIFTSAGVTAGIDLALHLLQADLGAKVALAVAQLLVVFLRRPGGQSQFSAALRARPGSDTRLQELVATIVESPASDYRVEVLAQRVGLSARQFSRVFREHIGVTPAAFVDQVRLDAARSLLEATALGVEEIAAECGWGTAESLRRAFQRALGVAPSAYRRRFAYAGRGSQEVVKKQC